MLTPDRVEHIKRFHQDATVPEDVLRTWLSELLAEVRQLTEDRDRLFEERNRALDVLTHDNRDILLAKLTDAEADRDQERDALAAEKAALEQEHTATCKALRDATGEIAELQRQNEQLRAEAHQDAQEAANFHTGEAPF